MTVATHSVLTGSAACGVNVAICVAASYATVAVMGVPAGHDRVKLAGFSVEAPIVWLKDAVMELKTPITGGVLATGDVKTTVGGVPTAGVPNICF